MQNFTNMLVLARKLTNYQFWGNFRWISGGNYAFFLIQSDLHRDY